MSDEQQIKVVEGGPSGALSYNIDGEAIEPDLPASVAVVPDGPFTG